MESRGGSSSPGRGEPAAEPARPAAAAAAAADIEAQEREATLRMQMVLLRQLVESGEKDRLLASLREQLQEAGWQEQVKEHVKGVLERKGPDQVMLDELVAETLPHARAIVPDEVKAETLRAIRRFLQPE